MRSLAFENASRGCKEIDRYGYRRRVVIFKQQLDTADCKGAETYKDSTSAIPTRGDRSTKEKPTASSGGKDEAITVVHSSKTTKGATKKGTTQGEDRSKTEGTTFVCNVKGNYIEGTS